jgi:hypothetical protein
VRHFLLTVLYAACVAAFFGTMLRDDWKSGLRLGGSLFGLMAGGVFVAGWLMYWLAP